jgi:pimeloyl-ACP methyl ester carboxylesterase
MLFDAPTPVRWIASQRFDSLAKAKRVMVPVLQVHAPEDWLVPIEAARTLFAQIPGTEEMLELPGGHNDVGFNNEAFQRALGRFWSSIERRGATISRPDAAPRVPLTDTPASLAHPRWPSKF